MRWRGRRTSSNVDDRRGMSPKGMAVGGGAGAIILLLVVMFLGGDPSSVINQLPANPGATVQTGPGGKGTSPEQDELAQFTSVVLADTEEVWRALFSQAGRTYQEPKVVLFSGQVRSACGFASAASGPFYCPGDQQVYLDLNFFDELRRRFKAPGDFAQAYVVAHEVGHHVQNLLGLTQQVHSQRGRISQEEYNQLSVRLELQADFMAGVWAHHAHRAWNILEEGDIEEALQAATAIGDDTIQRRTQGRVVPESFTHGTSEQRMRWFRRGLETGDMSQGDTFSQARL